MGQLNYYTLLILGIVCTSSLILVEEPEIETPEHYWRTTDRATIADFNIGGMREDLRNSKNIWMNRDDHADKS